ncbi:MAG: amidohydrolase family protein [Pirellula sp.]|jgi:imidazolonepropionase-like amidohydrolase|nr:amidohydrolase family protein [Pirellula sp.]
MLQQKIIPHRVRFSKLICLLVWSCSLACSVVNTTAPTWADEAVAPSDLIAVRAGKVITCAGDPIIDGVVLIEKGKIRSVGPFADAKLPEGCTVIHHPDSFAMPGLIEAHSHVGGTGDLNEMVYQTNPELRNWDQIIPHNPQLKVAIAGGVTTVCFIPGSGTNMGGWGTLMKTGPGKLSEIILKAPGVLKIAQAGNPERTAGEVGSGRVGMNHVIRQQLLEGRLYVQQWDAYESGKTTVKPELNLRLEYFKPLFHQEIPVVVHTQQYQVVQSTLRMLVDEMNLKIVIDHGTFDAFKLAEEVNKRDIPVMAGPRGFWMDPANGQIRGIVVEYANRGTTLLGVNTDAPVIPQEELSFQATMAVRYGWDEEKAIRGVTIEAAKALMIADRVGSLEPGKDADIVISTGSIIDPRNYVQQVFINGKSVYDIKVDRRRF